MQRYGTKTSCDAQSGRAGPDPKPTVDNCVVVKHLQGIPADHDGDAAVSGLEHRSKDSKAVVHGVDAHDGGNAMTLNNSTTANTAFTLSLVWMEQARP